MYARRLPAGSDIDRNESAGIDSDTANGCPFVETDDCTCDKAWTARADALRDLAEQFAMSTEGKAR